MNAFHLLQSIFLHLKLVLNVHKTEFIVFSKAHPRMFDDLSVGTDAYKYLGIKFDDKFLSNVHIACPKLKGELFFTLEINLFTLLPVIDYGDTLYVSSSVLRSLHVVYNASLCFIIKSLTYHCVLYNLVG